MKVCVVIVGFRNPDDIIACIGALTAQIHADFEVLICENGGAEAFRTLVDLLPETLSGGQAVGVIEAADNPGYAGGINRVFAARPDADAWWILNPDTMPAPGALAAMVAKLASGEADAIGSLLIDRDGEVQNTGGWFRSWLGRSESLGRGREAADPRMNFIMGASMLVGPRWLAVAGPMRDDYFLYCEEVEWCLRGQALGLRIAVATDAHVVHHQGTTTGSAGSMASRQRLPIYLDERNKLNTVRDTRPILLISAIPSALVLAVLRYGRRGAWRQLGYALSGWLSGIANQRGKPGWLTR